MNNNSQIIDTESKYVSKGVTAIPAVDGEKLKVKYNGLLAKSGATSVVAHVGFHDGWIDTSDYQMKKTKQGFEADIPVKYSGSVNICFKDSANNWDNNTGRNYTFEL